jgi:hypothetical protein
MLISDIATIERAKALADVIRAKAPDMAAAIDDLVRRAQGAGESTVAIRFNVEFTLEKFEDGRLVETIKGEG